MKKLLAILLPLFILCGCAAAPRETETTTATTTAATLPTPDKLIAITFDDGPEPNMDTILDILRQYNAKATFFVIGSQIKDENAYQLQRAVEEGHEIGNHGFAHADLTKMTSDAVTEDIAKTQQTVKDITGKEPVWFRPPFLAISPVTNLLIRMPHAGMGVSAQDGTNGNSAEERIRLVTEGAYDGAIVLMHSNNITPKALPQILETLQLQGYEFVTVSELFARAEKTPESGINTLYKDNH